MFGSIGEWDTGYMQVISLTVLVPVRLKNYWHTMIICLYLYHSSYLTIIFIQIYSYKYISDYQILQVLHKNLVLLSLKESN